MQKAPNENHISLFPRKLNDSNSCHMDPSVSKSNVDFRQMSRFHFAHASQENHGFGGDFVMAPNGFNYEGGSAQQQQDELQGSNVEDVHSGYSQQSHQQQGFQQQQQGFQQQQHGFYPPQYQQQHQDCYMNGKYFANQENQQQGFRDGFHPNGQFGQPVGVSCFVGCYPLQERQNIPNGNFEKQRQPLKPVFSDMNRMNISSSDLDLNNSHVDCATSETSDESEMDEEEDSLSTSQMNCETNQPRIQEQNKFNSKQMNDEAMQFFHWTCDLMTRSYTESIFVAYREREVEFLPTPTYMNSIQSDVTSQMREVLIDWLNEVCQDFKLETQTLFLCVNYIDRFLSLIEIPRQQLQLCGATCLLVASKYNEKAPPLVSDFVYITDYAYTRSDFLNMESLILNSLNFTLSAVTPLDYIELYLSATPVQNTNLEYPLRVLVRYIVEITLQRYNFIRYRPSSVIIACICVAMASFHIQPLITPKMKGLYQLKDCEKENVVRCVHDVWKAFVRQVTQPSKNCHAVKGKYLPYQQMMVGPSQYNPAHEVHQLLEQSL